jgi:hypothetical protein
MKLIDKQQSVQLADGREAKLIVPALVKSLAIVDLAVITRLAEMLPSVPLYELTSEMAQKINTCYTFEEYIEALRAELSFHETVNILTKVDSEEVQEQIATVNAKGQKIH